MAWGWGRSMTGASGVGGKGGIKGAASQRPPLSSTAALPRTQENAIRRVGCGHSVEPMVLVGTSATEAEFSGSLWHKEEAVQDQGPGSWKGAPGMR